MAYGRNATFFPFSLIPYFLSLAPIIPARNLKPNKKTACQSSRMPLSGMFC